MKIMIPFELTEKYIGDVLYTAFSGGSNYWIDSVKTIDNPHDDQYPSECVAKGGTIEVVDNEYYKAHILNAEIFAKGFQKYADFCIKRGREICFNSWEVDAEISDIILQFTLFSDIIFG